VAMKNNHTHSTGTGTLSRSELIAIAVVVRSHVDIKKCNHTHSVRVTSSVYKCCRACRAESHV
jgi:hypothetical protein